MFVGYLIEWIRGGCCMLQGCEVWEVRAVIRRSICEFNDKLLAFVFEEYVNVGW